MFPALLARRIENAVLTTPAFMRWLELCRPEVIEAFRSARRSLFTWQLPALLAIAAVAFPIKAFRWLPVGHPFLLLLFMIAIAVLAWPPPIMHFAATAWRSAPGDSRFGARLRVLASVLFVCAVVALIGLAVLAAFFTVSLLK